MPTLNYHREEKRRRDDFRAVYQSSRWHRYSRQYLKLNRLCVMCLSEGKTVVARVTDHRIPMTAGGEIWASSNHQALCFSCHNRKTYNEKRKKMAIVNVVYGPPCSGKSTVIQQRMRFGDYILDMDEIAKCFLKSSTKDHRLRNEQQIKDLLDIRDSIVKVLLPKPVTIWIPTTYLNGYIFKDLQYHMIDNMKTKEECLQYLESSDRINKDYQIDAINEWFEKHRI